jgi:hypothetical protein
MSAKCSVQLATRLVFGPLFSADYGPWARGARGICTSKKFFRKFRKEQIAWGKSNPWRCFLSRGMQNQQLINWSLGGASRLPSAGRHFAGEPSSPVIRPRHSPVRHFAPPRRGVGSLRAVPSSWTAISNLPSPSTPIPISRPMRRPGRRARCGDRSVSNPSRALLLRGHYLLLCRASSLLGEGEIAVAVAEGLGADVKWPGGCLGSLEAIKWCISPSRPAVHAEFWGKW